MPGKSRKGGGLESSPVYKKQAYGTAKSPFTMKRSPAKKNPLGEGGWLYKQMKKPGVTESILGFMTGGTKGLERLAYGGAALAGSAYGLIKGYGNLAKQKHGKQIIKDSGVGRTRKI